MSTTVREVRKEAARASYAPRLKVQYEQELRPRLQDELELSSLDGRPARREDHAQHGRRRGEDRREALDSALEELTIIAGQRALVRRARKSIAQFKIREGMPIGAKVTLRGARMYEFLDRLIAIALPRIRDFRGLSPRSFDGRGNYSLGIREQIIFPEIDYDKIDQVRGLDVAITTTAKTDEEARELLRGLGMPFGRTEGSSSTMAKTR